jgi:hypothetical protein
VNLTLEVTRARSESEARQMQGEGIRVLHGWINEESSWMLQTIPVRSVKKVRFNRFVSRSFIVGSGCGKGCYDVAVRLW